MTRILSASRGRHNSLKSLWRNFKSLDKFTKATIVFFIVLIFVTPFIVNNYQIFKPRAQTPPQKPINNIVFNDQTLNLFISGILGPFIKSYDSFTLFSGNESGSINVVDLNRWASAIHQKYPSSQIYAATSGIENITNGAPLLDKSLFTGFMYVYEPNRANEPEFTWDRAETERIWREVASIIRAQGLEAWGKPSGRALAGRDHAGAWDHGVLGTIMDGQNIQTQGSCDLTDSFSLAINDIISQFKNAGATSQLFVQITIAPGQTNSVDPAVGIECAKVAWSEPMIKRLTLWIAGSYPDPAAAFLQLRENLLAEESITPASTEVTPTPTPTSTPIPTPTPTSIPADNTFPTTSITSPLNGSTVTRGSTVTINANASDNVKISKVEFYINSSLKCVDMVSPYSCAWSVPSKKTTYKLQTKAYDTSLNFSSSPIVTVNAK